MNRGSGAIRKMKLEAVAAILDGTMKETDAAEKFGVSASDIVEWKTMFAAGILYSLQSETTPQTRARLSRKKRAAVAAGLLLVLIVGGATAAPSVISTCEDNEYFFCFQPNSPAKASEINHNFALMSEWVEGAVGPVGAPAIDSTTEMGVTAVNNILSVDSAEFSAVEVEGVISAGDMALTGSATVGQQMTVGTDFTADREDEDTDNDYDLSVDGDVHIAGTLQLDGQIDGLLTVSDEFVSLFPGPPSEMTDASRSVCFLTGHYLPLTIPSVPIGGEFANCSISAADGAWVLTMTGNPLYSAGSTCSARCISW